MWTSHALPVPQFTHLTLPAVFSMEGKGRYLKLEKAGRRSPSTPDWISALRRGRRLCTGSQAPRKSFYSPPGRNTLFRTVLRKQSVACLSVMSLVMGFPGGASSKEFTCQFRQCKRCRFEVKVAQLCLTSCSPGQNTGVGSCSFLQRIFPAQSSNPALPHCRWILYELSHQGSPRILEWAAYPFSSRSSQPRNWTWVYCIWVDSLPAELPGKLLLVLCHVKSSQTRDQTLSSPLAGRPLITGPPGKSQSQTLNRSPELMYSLWEVKIILLTCGSAVTEV